MTYSPSLLLTLAVLAAGCGRLLAADPDSDDLRVSGGILPGIKSVVTEGTTSDISAKIGGDGQIDYQHLGYVDNGQWGWLAGVGAFADFQKGTLSGTDLTSDAYGAAVDIGVAFRVADVCHFELAPFFGVGEDYLTSNSVTGHGAFLKYGATLAAFWDFDPHWQVGIDGGWEAFRGKASADYAGIGSDQDVTYKGSGALAGLSLGYCF